MKKLTLDDWEKEYIAGAIKRFDQKYTMFNRPVWDSEIRGRLDNWSFTEETKSKPGSTLEELALSRATRPIQPARSLSPVLLRFRQTTILQIAATSPSNNGT